MVWLSVIVAKNKALVGSNEELATKLSSDEVKLAKTRDKLRKEEERVDEVILAQQEAVALVNNKVARRKKDLA